MSNFSTNKIFENSNVNALLDRMYYFLKESAAVPDVDAVFALTGRAAVFLQDGTTGACDQVVFITNNAALYSYVQKGLEKKLSNKGIIYFKERTIFFMPGFAMEIWFTINPLSILQAQGIYVEDKAKINPILL